MKGRSVGICVRCGELVKIFSHYGRCESLPMCYVCYHREYRQRNKEKLRARYLRDQPKILRRQRARRARLKEAKRLAAESEI